MGHRIHGPREAAHSRLLPDPAPLEPTDLGGAWSSYWYNRAIYESSITEGLNIFRLMRGDVRRESMMLHHLNPQTQEFSIARGRSRMTQSWWPAVSPGHRRARTVPTVR